MSAVSAREWVELRTELAQWRAIAEAYGQRLDLLCEQVRNLGGTPDPTVVKLVPPVTGSNEEPLSPTVEPVEPEALSPHSEPVQDATEAVRRSDPNPIAAQVREEGGIVYVGADPWFSCGRCRVVFDTAEFSTCPRCAAIAREMEWDIARARALTKPRRDTPAVH